MRVKYFLILIFIFYGGVSIVFAAQPAVNKVSMVARGSAVVIKDLATARQQAVADTLNNALDRYIHEKMVSGHGYDEMIKEQMLNQQDRYILSYEIISDRLLGDLLQLELRVNFNKSLLQEDLATILKSEKRAVQDIRLIIIQENINNQLLSEPLLTQAVLLSPEELAKQLNDELTAYGFHLTLNQNISDNLKELLTTSIHPDNTLAKTSTIDMKQFQYLLPGELTIYIGVGNFHEERINTVHKQLLTVEDTLAFIDLKNRTSTILPAIINKSLTDYLPSGISVLSAELVGDVIEIARRCDAVVIAPFELVQFCLRRGVKKNIAMNIGGNYNEPSFSLKMTNAQHSSAYITDADIIYTGSPCGYLITIQGKTIYFAGDTALFNDMSTIAANPIQLALLPIGDRFTMGVEDARRAVEMLQPDLVVPMHYNTWEIINQDPEKFVASIADLGCRGVVLGIEEHLLLS